MHYKITQREDIAETFLPIAELQEHVRTLDPHDEELLASYRLAAISFAEAYMNRALGVHTVMCTFDNYRGRLYLPLGQVHEVTQVTAIDSNNETYILDSSDFRFNHVSSELIISGKHRSLKDFIVEYSVGYHADDIPAAIKVGCMKLVATFFENREDVANGISASEVPFNHRACFDLYRIQATA